MICWLVIETFYFTLYFEGEPDDATKKEQMDDLIDNLMTRMQRAKDLHPRLVTYPDLFTLNNITYVIEYEDEGTRTLARAIMKDGEFTITRSQSGA